MRSECITNKTIREVQQEKLSKCTGTPLALEERKAPQPDKNHLTDSKLHIKTIR